MPRSLRTFCFGRYAVDLPASACLLDAGNQYQGFHIAVEAMSPEQFRQLLVRREATLRARKVGGRAVYVEARYARDPAMRLLLSAAERENEVELGVDTFRYMAEGYAFTTHAAGVPTGELMQTLARFERYLAALRYRARNAAPAGAGFCFDHGVVLDAADKPQQEHADLRFSLPAQPGLQWQFESDVLSDAAPSLIERFKHSSLADLGTQNLRVLRQRARAVNGLVGEEIALRLPATATRAARYMFTWEAPGTPHAVGAPRLRFEMNSGGAYDLAAPTEWSEAEALQCFDDVLGGLRALNAATEVAL